MNTTESTTQTQTAESSTATLLTPSEMTPAQRQEWRETGKKFQREPKAAAKTEESATSQSAEGTSPEETAPATESGKLQGQERKPKGNAETRKQQLGSEIQDLLKKRDELRKELAADEAKKAKPGTKDDKPAEPSTAKPDKKAAEDPRPQQTDKDDKGNAKYKSFDEYIEALTDWKARRVAQDEIGKTTAAAEQAKKQAEVDASNRAMEENWRKRVDEAKKKHSDFEDIAFAKDLPIRSGSPIDRYILESEHGALVLYHLAKHRDEITRISQLSNTLQIRELAKLESTLTEKPPVKKVTTASGPAHEVGGRGSSPADPIADAVKKGDFLTFKKERNAAGR